MRLQYKFSVPEDTVAILRRFALRDTQSRRLVLKAFMHFTKPVAHKEIYNWLQKKDAAINLVTVYRILGLFEERGIIHKHPSSGGFILCSMNDEAGHHGFLSCEECGKVEEFIDKTLCGQEDRIAKKAGFAPKNHISEIVGVCAECH